MSDRERQLLYQILRQLVHDCEISVRKLLGEKLAGRADVPRELAMSLARDDAEVAFPILKNCGVLKDEDLIEVIQTRSVHHQLAVAIRFSVSEDVSDSLVETGHHEVITRLLSNANAKISERTMDYLVAESERVDMFHEPILHRDDLSPALAQKMFTWVSAALREHILKNFDVDEVLIDDTLEQSAFELFSSGHVSRDTNTGRMLAEALDKAGEATPSLMIQALECGEVPLFVSMLQQMTGLRETLITRFIMETGGEGLVVTCRSLGVGKADFVQLFTLCRKLRPLAGENFGDEVRNVLAMYNNVTRETANQVVARWGRDTNYLQAIREIELAS